MALATGRLRGIFTQPTTLWPEQKRLLDDSYARSREHFESRQAHDAFFSNLITPKSGRWAFVSTGKTATSSALDLLFSLEFGFPNSVSLNDPSDLNHDPQTHRCVNHGIFRVLRQRADLVSFHDYLDQTLRVATVRHPANRLWSAFRYICRSDREKHPMFLADRLKMCAVVGFDWTKHPETKDGLVRFLDYISYICEQTVGLGLNNHWQPQWMVVRPTFFRPDIVGRAEQPDQFARDLITRLDGDPNLVPLRRNQSMAAENQLPAFFHDPEVRCPLARIYEGDFQAFGYDM